MRIVLFATILNLVVPVGVGFLAAADTAIDESQTAFDRWVTLQESMASEKTDWGVEKEYLNEEIRLLTEEIAALREKHSRLTNETATIEADLAEVGKANAELEAAAELVEERLPDLENNVRKLNQVLPPSLQSTIEMLVNRLPEQGAIPRASASERMQVVVGVLSQVDKANGQLSVQTEVRSNLMDEKVQVRVLYLGLAKAWFVSQDGKFAGHGSPGVDGWAWTPDDTLGPIVSRAIAIHDGTEVASYVDLPVSYK